ncbi:MAG: hypothetical protein ABIR91_04925, partial [Candidatus Saccharimonadales bacterium]
PSTIKYGIQPLGDMLGADTFVKIVSGAPENWEITLQNIAGDGHVLVRKDGGSWTDAGGTYSVDHLASFAQSNNRVYIVNGFDNMSYYDIDTGNVITYNEITDPTGLSSSKTGLSGTSYTFYYRVSASNNVGETGGSNTISITTDKLRNEWVAGTDKVDLTWTAVPLADTYNIYVGTSPGNEKQIATGITSTAFKDDGTAGANPFKITPAGNSTKGPTLTYIYNKNAQLFGVGDVDNPSYMWYSGTGKNSGDFSPFNGGGYVGIDYGGSTIPVAVRAFRDGKGTPVVTVLSKGQAGTGKFSHVTFNLQTIDTSIQFYVPEVYEANGQAGTVAPRAVVEANNSLYYLTGMSVNTTGTKPNVVNILTTDDIAQGIAPDLKGLTLNAMHKAVGLEYQGKIFFSVPFGTQENSEIWILDLSRRGAWILRWTVPAKFMWLYEDNSGTTHHCVVVDNKILEFTDQVKTTDDGVAFSTRITTGRMTFDEAGVGMASIQYQRFKLLYPRGTIRINTYGLGEAGETTNTGNKAFKVNVSNTGYGAWMYDSSNPIRLYDGDVGVIATLSRSMEVVPVEIDEIVNELYDEIITDGPNCDYVLSTINTQGIGIPKYFYGDQ